MCGVLFAYEYKNDSQNLQRRAIHALERLKHRGPDEQNALAESNWLIGHTRLSILDIAGSRQPMSSAHRPELLTFNGEIYNFAKLKRDLENKWKFTTNGDTEVLLAGLSVYGKSFIGKLEGMWAFILWNPRQGALLASRDPLGKKPLYFCSNTKGIYFASELPALRTLDTESWSENPSASAALMKYGFTAPGETSYENVFELKPGHNLCWQPGSTPIQHQYWQLQNIREQHLSFEDSCELVEQKIKFAVQKRMIADVEIGAFLSGGLDSSIVATLAQHESSSRLRTFTVKFADKGYDESRYANTVASALKSQHHEIEAETPTLDDLKLLLKESVGQPFGDPSLLPTFSLCKATAQHVKVALSGDGADEVFSGYQRYQAKVILSWYRRLPTAMQKTADSIIERLPANYAHHSKSLIKKAKEFSRLANDLEFNTDYYAPTLGSSTLIRSETRTSLRPGLEPESNATTLEEMMYRDMLVYLPQDILTKVDRASMHSSLEVRSPFLDIELVELAFSLPIDFHRSLTKGKLMLRTIYQHSLPHEVIKRRKQGFSNPIHTWFNGPLGDKLIKVNSEIDSIISTVALHEAVNIHQSKKQDMSIPLWNALCYLLWKSDYQL